MIFFLQLMMLESDLWLFIVAQMTNIESSKVGVCLEFLFLFHRTLTVVLFCLKITISHRTCFYGRFSFVKNVTCFPNFLLIAKNSSRIVSKFRDLQIYEPDESTIKAIKFLWIQFQLWPSPPLSWLRIPAGTSQSRRKKKIPFRRECPYFDIWYFWNPLQHWLSI